MNKGKKQEQNKEQLEGLVKLQQIFESVLRQAFEDAANLFPPVIMKFMLLPELDRRKYNGPVYAVQLVFKERGKPPTIKLNNEVLAEITFADGTTKFCNISQQIWERFDEIERISAPDVEGSHITFLLQEQQDEEGKRWIAYKTTLDVSKVWPLIVLNKDAKQCKQCNRWFKPEPRNAWRQKYCSDKCRYKAGNERKKLRKIHAI